MKIKNIWTNYKIYAFILGIITGTVVYNLLGVDFSFANILKVKGTKFINSFMYFGMINLKFWIVVLALSFLKLKDQILFIIIFIEAFLLSGFISISITIESMVLFYEVPIVIFKIVCALLLFNERKPIFYKFISALFLVAGTVLENIFFVYI